MAFKKGISFSGFFVVILALRYQEVVGQNATTAALPGGNVTIEPTTIQPTSSSLGFETKVIAVLEVDRQCDVVNKSMNLTDVIKGVYSKASYDYESSEIKMGSNGEKCVVSITMKFGKDLTETGIIKQFKDAIASLKIKVTLKDIQAQVAGVSIEYRASGEGCKKCCSTGGPFKVTAKCTPENRCVNYIKEKESDDCKKYCHCDGTMFKVSLLVLVACGLINLFLKE